MIFQSSIKKDNLIKSRIIGNVEKKGWKDGSFEEARFFQPTGICFLSNRPIGFICDCGNHCIRMIDFGQEKVITLIGKTQKRSYQDIIRKDVLTPYRIVIHPNQQLLFVSDIDNEVINQIDISSIHRYQNLNQTSSQKCLQNLESINCNNENGSNFLVSVVCGSYQQVGFVDGIGNEAKLSIPTEMAFSELNENILYFCDSGNGCIRKVNILTKQVSTIAGNPNQIGFKDGIGNVAQFYGPRGICVDKNENLFVCDYENHLIRKINSNQQSSQWQPIVSTLFGNPINVGMKDGNNSIATLKYPHSILFDRISNCLIFTQQHSIRQIKLGKCFSEWKLKKIFFIYRILFRQCEKSISKRVLLQLVSLQILQISSSNEDANNNNNKNNNQQNKKIIIEKQNKIIEYLKSTKPNLETKSNLFEILF